MNDGKMLVLDVRLEAEYAAGLIPDAVSLPHGQLPTRFAELPRESDIVAYCRSRYCAFAPSAVRLLRARGFSARPLGGSLPRWRRVGSPLSA
jgi:rhodanese-related sulfurtransferase